MWHNMSCVALYKAPGQNHSSSHAIVVYGLAIPLPHVSPMSLSTVIPTSIVELPLWNCHCSPTIVVLHVTSTTSLPRELPVIDNKISKISKFFNFSNYPKMHNSEIFSEPPWDPKLNLKMVYFFLVHIKLTSAHKIWHSRVDFSTNFVVEIGAFANFA